MVIDVRLFLSYRPALADILYFAVTMQTLLINTHPHSLNQIDTQVPLVNLGRQPVSDILEYLVHTGNSPIPHRGSSIHKTSLVWLLVFAAGSIRRRSAIIWVAFGLF